MSISKHIYYADSEYPRTVILNHGGSETTILSDSDDKIPYDSGKYRRVWTSREGRVPEKEENRSWLSAALQRAKDNGDLNE